MTTLSMSLKGLNVLVIDTTDASADIAAAFLSLEAIVSVVVDASEYDDQASIPDIAVIDPESISDRKLRAVAFQLVSEDTCISIIYSKDSARQSELGDIIHKSCPIDDVLNVATRMIAEKRASAEHCEPT